MADRSPSVISCSKSSTQKKPRPAKVNFKRANVLKPHHSKQMSKKSLIEAETDEFPFDFEYNNRNRKSSKVSESNVNRYSVKNTRGRSVRRSACSGDISDVDIYVMADIFEHQQLPNMSDLSEGVNLN